MPQVLEELATTVLSTATLGFGRGGAGREISPSSLPWFFLFPSGKYVAGRAHHPALPVETITRCADDNDAERGRAHHRLLSLK